MPPEIMFKNVCVRSTFNGCVINSYLLTRIYNFLISNGINMSDNPDECEAIIIGTCANVDADEKKAIADIEKYIKKYLGKKQIIVTGCLPDINPDFFKAKKGVIAIGAKSINDFNALFNARRPIGEFKSNNLHEKFCLDELVPDDSYYKYYSPAKYYIEISRGCLNNCSYCVIKKAKGRLQSKPLDLVINEFRKGIRLGFKKFVLLGDECGGYGLDSGSSFVKLLERAGRIKGDFEILISNLEPGRLVSMYPSLKEALSRLKVSYINLPLQSGNDRVIRLMNRRYRAREVIKIVKDIKRISPATQIETNFIYGFPTETRKEFMDSLKAAKFFDTASFFIYSKREGTPAEKLKGAISQKEINYRTNCIRRLRSRNPQKYCFADIKMADDEGRSPLKRKVL